ncbi:glycosyltransferase family 4 protein [Microbacterium sp. PF5]|uniref:glycosyltransferase family 4 protein n=1 Tax=Microbacterium sp. PF5 TaxID=2305435 RepID=UPI00109BBAED|nr:glycosyltransferase family 4 protein [Microbacterium sp. PF5]
MPDLGARAYRLAQKLVPSSVAGYVLPGHVRQFRETGVTVARDAPRRLLIAPVNSAGQGYAWARAAETLPGVAAASAMFRGGDDVFGFHADHLIPATALVGNARWRRAQHHAILHGFTHVLIESGRHLSELDGDPLELVRELQAAGVRVALVWHGSDIRLPSAHAAREPDSPFHGDRYAGTAVLEEIAERHARFAEAAGVPVFVSTPDLLPFAPGATWLPVVVDPRSWAAAGDRPALSGDGPLRVVHAPSSAGLKGSDRIAAAVQRLEAEGLIEYTEVRGVPAERMPELYGGADVVLDQFLAGAYGVAVCEALAAGRLVVSHVSDDTREAVRAASGHELPVVQARAPELEGVLREVAANRARSATRAAEGPAFVRAVHDGTMSAEALRPFLDA